MALCAEAKMDSIRPCILLIGVGGSYYGFYFFSFCFSFLKYIFRQQIDTQHTVRLDQPPHLPCLHILSTMHMNHVLWGLHHRKALVSFFSVLIFFLVEYSVLHYTQGLISLYSFGSAIPTLTFFSHFQRWRLRTRAVK